MTQHESETNRPTLQPSSLGKFIQLNGCSRYFDFRFGENGFDAVNHPKSPETFPETFFEDNIVEKQQGNAFEDDVFDTITAAVPTVINMDELTLSHVAETIPDETTRILSKRGWDGSIENTHTDTIDYHGIPAGEIHLCDPEPVIAASTTSETETSETDDDRDQRIRNGLFRLRDAYTSQLFGYLTANITELGSTLDAPFPVPTEKVPASDTRRTRKRTEPVVIYQPSFSTEIGAWPVAGDADAVLIWPDEQGSDAVVRVLDVKMATEEQTHHQMQTSVYAAAIAHLDTVVTADLTIQAGVITQGDSYLPATPEAMPQFDLASRQADLRRITSPGNLLDTAFNTAPAESEYQLDSKCSNCQYNEVCYVDTVEKAGLELLGLGRGVQEQLQNNGVADLNDLAGLAENATTTHALQSKAWDVDPRESRKPDVTRDNRSTYNKLAEIPGLGEQLPLLIEKAQMLLTNTNPQHRNVRGGLNKAQFITGSGEGTLPTDAFLSRGDATDSEYLSGSLVRVYINVQHDHIRDKISGIGFHVTATASDTTGISWAQMDRTMSTEPDESCHDEFALLDDFATAVQEAIQSVSAGIDFTNYRQTDPFIHLFTFTEQERQTLEETLSLYLTGAITDEPTVTDATGASTVAADDFQISPPLRRLRGLLGMRGGESQQMVSVISQDIESRMGVSVPTSGLVNVYSEFFPTFNSDERFERTDWSYAPNNPSRAPEGQTTINLQSVFRHRLFNSSLPCESTQSGVQFQIDGGVNWAAEDEHTVRVRTGAQIPLAYLWAASGRITDDWVADVRDHGSNAVINPYRYHRNNDEYVQPIVPEDVEALLKRMCECTRHIEQGILVKSPIEVDETESESPEERVSNASITGEHK